jgi:hypothetical protein
MVRLGFSLLYKPVPDLHRKHDVCLTVSVDMAQFTPAIPELGPSEPVRARNDPFPSRDLTGDSGPGAADCQLVTCRAWRLIFIESALLPHCASRDLSLFCVSRPLSAVPYARSNHPGAPFSSRGTTRETRPSHSWDRETSQSPRRHPCRPLRWSHSQPRS